jgi:hypothetical protein
MALRIRRGTNTQRQQLTGGNTPLDGELIWTTDTKQLYVGDGTTTGGVLITGSGGSLDTLADTDLTGAAEGDVLAYNTANANWIPATPIKTIGDLNDVVSSNPEVGDIISWDGTFWSLRRISEIFGNGENVNVNIVSDGSTIMVDTANETFAGTLNGNVVGDVQGSVFADDSTLLVDGISGNIYASTITTNRIEGNRFLDIQSIDATNNLVTRQYQPEPGNYSEIYTLTNGITGSGQNTFVSRGNIIEPTAVQGGDILYGQNTVSHDGTQFQLTSAVNHMIDPYQPISTGVVPGVISFSTFTDGNPANFKGMVIDSRGYTAINNGLLQSQATLDINGFAKLAVLTAEPTTLVNGLIAIADGVTWNPTASGIETVVAYINGGWTAIS